MARKTDILLGQVAYGSGSNAPMLDPTLGGQWGYATNPSEWLSAQAYLPRNLIPIVLETPRFFELMPNPEKWVAAWKLYFEKHCRTIEGLKAGLTVDVVEHAFGAAGEFFQEFADVKRERSTLTTTSVEKYGNVWQEFWGRVITYGMMDPETKAPLTSTLANGPTDNLADNYSGSIAFIEPDETGKKCRRCWITTNIWPQGTGPIEGKMDKTSALSIKELSLEFSALSFIGAGTRSWGQELMDGISKQWANPQIRESFIKEVSADVKAVTRGFSESVESVAQQRVGDVI